MDESVCLLILLFSANDNTKVDPNKVLSVIPYKIQTPQIRFNHQEKKGGRGTKKKQRARERLAGIRQRLLFRGSLKSLTVRKNP